MRFPILLFVILSLVAGHDIAVDDWLSWITVSLLAVGLARVPTRSAWKIFCEDSSTCGV